MDRVNYFCRADVPPVVRGDSLDAMVFHLSTSDGDPFIPVSVCAQIVDNRGLAVHIWDASINADTGEVSLDAVLDTYDILPLGVYRYSVRYTMADGFSRTYFGGSITVLQGGPLCSP